jgi:hypothetical protein
MSPAWRLSRQPTRAPQAEKRFEVEAVVHELAIDLVGDQEQAAPPGQVHELGQGLPRVRGAGGVRGVADDDGAGAVVHGCLEGGDGRQGEAVLDRGRQRDELEAGHHGEAAIVRIARLHGEDAAPRVGRGGEGEEERLGAAGGDQEVGLAHVEAEGAVRLHVGLAQRIEPHRRPVRQHAALFLAGVAEEGRSRGQVGLADVEAVDLHAPLGGGTGGGLQLADRRRRSALPAPGDEGLRHQSICARCSTPL